MSKDLLDFNNNFNLNRPIDAMNQMNCGRCSRIGDQNLRRILFGARDAIQAKSKIFWLIFWRHVGMSKDLLDFNNNFNLNRPMR